MTIGNYEQLIHVNDNRLWVQHWEMMRPVLGQTDPSGAPHLSKEYVDCLQDEIPETLIHCY